MGKCGVKKMMVYGIVFLGIGSTTLLQSHALSSPIVQCPLKCPCYGHSPGSKLRTPSFKMASLNIQKPQKMDGFSYGSVSKPCTPGEHQNSWYMDVHSPKNGINILRDCALDCG